MRRTFRPCTSSRPVGRQTDEADEFVISGQLTLHGVTAEVALDVELLDFGPGRAIAQLSGLGEATTTLDRNTFGVGAHPQSEPKSRSPSTLKRSCNSKTAPFHQVGIVILNDPLLTQGGALRITRPTLI